MSSLAVKSNSKRGVDKLVASFFKIEGFAAKLPGQYKVQLKALVSELKAFAIKQFKEIASENEWLRQQNDVLIKENDTTKVNKTFEKAVVRASVQESLSEEVELLPVRSSYAQKIISDPIKQVSSQWQEEPIYKVQKASLLLEAASNDNSHSYNLDDYLAKFAKRYDVPNDFHEANNVWTYMKSKEEQVDVLQDAKAFKDLSFDDSKALLPSLTLAPIAALTTCAALATVSFTFGGSEMEDVPQLQPSQPEEAIEEVEEKQDEMLFTSYYTLPNQPHEEDKEETNTSLLKQATQCALECAQLGASYVQNYVQDHWPLSTSETLESCAVSAAGFICTMAGAYVYGALEI